MTLNLKKQNINFDNPNLDDVQTNQKYFIDVCAGAGGLSLGFMIQKFKPMLLNDVDKNCVETLKLNHPYTNIYHGKMETLNLEKYQNSNLDVLMTGIPCQPFSTAGNQKGFKDSRESKFKVSISMQCR